jgi:UDP-glucose 4-epimerase
VLEYCRANNTPIIFSSSREVYGDIHRYITEEAHADFSFTESPYSASKISGEALIYSYARCYDLRYLVFRFSNVYGRYDSDIQRMERVIPLFIQRMAQGLPVTVYGREKVLDFTYVDDCVDGIVRGMERLLAGEVYNETINLAYGQGNTLVHMAELIAAALQVQPTIRVEPAKRTGEVTHYVADLSKATRLLDYRPRTELDQGIPQAVEWWQRWHAEHPPTPEGA